MQQLRLILIVSAMLLACNKQYPKAENALDAGREFIDGCLKGDFDKASFYMLSDPENVSMLRQMERDYNSRNNEDKAQYATASIIIIEDAAMSDTLHIISYRNSFDKVARKVKVIFANGRWQVDFKYTFDGNL